MNIGDVATRSGLPAKTIRYYEDIGLVKPLRSANGYRMFHASDVHKLAFLGRARALGFSIEDCRGLIKLYEDTDRESAEVKQIAEEHLSRIDDKIAELIEMRATLATLVDACAGDHRPDCPILADLASKQQSLHLKETG
ncbi:MULTISPECIES: Cu(I)-responsive transcriptional regulator [Rhodobacterales]|uniref:Cu(I)-responsive transcriptional regulator n=1 Tax=Pelagivirga sediminicola TaxID=2170575 RepID=A0A2T7G3N9_9RHOB|nr:MULTISPECIES: Cu(I)-responsive transcriptional regulator [Rhodobacterales]MCQ0090372.1 Cu(I)-responsive transcriptional regulator [Roseovarius sp. M141]PVA09029.1 Cu(I)-responsive transcriptional regulator [Pelagivirga sediminicola]